MGEQTYFGSQEQPGDDRLHALLALKRYEQPPAAAFDAFTAEFRRRREAEERAAKRNRQPSLWARLATVPAMLSRRWVYGLGLGYATAVVAFLMWLPGYEAQNVQPVHFEFQPVQPVEEVALPLDQGDEATLPEYDTTQPPSEEKF